MDYNTDSYISFIISISKRMKNEYIELSNPSRGQTCCSTANKNLGPLLDLLAISPHATAHAQHSSVIITNVRMPYI